MYILKKHLFLNKIYSYWIVIVTILRAVTPSVVTEKTFLGISFLEPTINGKAMFKEIIFFGAKIWQQTKIGLHY